MQNKYEKLFEPVKIGSMPVYNHLGLGMLRKGVIELVPVIMA